jgi:ubiquinone/menaquinone biosynthesis C-methylase UbiE
MNAPRAPTDYSMGVTVVERQRLLTECDIHRPETESLMTRIGIGPGWDALDLGCGD